MASTTNKKLAIQGKGCMTDGLNNKLFVHYSSHDLNNKGFVCY